MAVLATPPFLQFLDANGNPLVAGKVYTYAAGTVTPKATFTDSSGSVQNSNPVILDGSGSAVIWIDGSYKFEVRDSADVLIRTVDNITSFSTLAQQTSPFFQSFSGNGTQTVFTLSDDLGTDSKNLMVFVDRGLQSHIANGTFATDTIWTKGAGWTIGSGVATATGAISTGISQTATVTLVAGQAYTVVYTITRSAGGLIPSIGGQNGTERTASGTYRETIVAGTNQTIAFTGNGFTGTLDDVSITPAVSAGYDIISPTVYTVSGTSLSFATAPASGTNNIYVFAPSQLLGAASSAAAAAASSASSAATSASSAAAFAVSRNQWNFSTTTTMANPGIGSVRFNNATLASVTAIAIANQSGNIGNPDLSPWVNTWDDVAGSVRGTIYIFKDNANFAYYNVTGATTSNAGWNQLVVTHVVSSGSFSNLDALFFGFVSAGVVTGGITALTGDVTASGSGSVPATIANAAVTSAKLASSVISNIMDFRLTLTTGVPVTTSDVSAAGTVFFTPYRGNRISLFDGTRWDILTTAQLSISLASGFSSNLPYDVFAWNNAGTVALETTAWTNDTTRATALVYQDGVLVRSGTPTSKYIGTFRTVTATTTEDTLLSRLVFNNYNRVDRSMAVSETADSWSYTSATYRQANANTANSVRYVNGVAEEALVATANLHGFSSAGAVTMATGIGINSTTTNSAQVYGAIATGVNTGSAVPAHYIGVPAVGLVTVNLLEASEASGTTTRYGDDGTPGLMAAGLTATTRM